MERQWTGNNVDLDALCFMISKFFEEREFKVHVEKLNGRIDIIAVPQSRIILERIVVTIRGAPHDFIVKFESGKMSHKISFVGKVTQFFGGGILFLYGQKSAEEIEKLEKEFWDFLYVTIEHLSKINV